MKATTFHTKITNFMEANGFDNTNGWETTSCFSLLAPGKLPFLIDFIYEDGEENGRVRIYEADGNNTDLLKQGEFTTIEEAQEFILNYFF